MSVTVEWFGTVARFEGPAPVLAELALPERPGLTTVTTRVTDVDLDFSVVRTGSQWALIVDDRQLGSAGPVGDLWTRAWDHLELQMAARSTDPVFIHAGAVAIDGRGIIVPGRSGRGKTSLVLALVGAGGVYFSDEYALLDHHGWLHPYARNPHVRIESGRRGIPTPISRFTDRVGIEPVPIAGVVIAQYVPGSKWCPRTLDSRTCALEVIDNAVGARVRTPAVMDVAAAVARSAWCVDGMRSEPDEVAEWLGNRMTRSR